MSTTPHSEDLDLDDLEADEGAYRPFRPDSDLTHVSELFPPPWRKKLLQVNQQMHDARANDCARCETFDGPVAMACAFRGSDVELDGTPLCKWLEAQRQQQAVQERRAARERRLLRAGYTDTTLIAAIASAWTPPRPQRPTTKGFAALWEAVETFRQEPHRRSLTLLGGTGTGKSTAAAWLAAAADDAVVVRSEVVIPGDEWDALRKRARAASLVVLEDLGLEHRSQSGWEARQIEGLISFRHDAAKRTVITSNLLLTPPAARIASQDDSSIEGRYGDRALSRLMDKDHGCIVVRCGKDDLRRVAP